jgi:hypothetical protein
MKMKKEEKEKQRISEDLKKIMALPFIAEIGERKNKKRIHWCVKATGDYFNDCEIGRKYGALALKCMKETGYTPLFAECVKEMKTNKEITGIEVGFLNFIASAAMNNNIDPLILAEHQKTELAAVIANLKA